MDALRPLSTQQSVAHDEQIGERAGHEQPVRVLVQPAVADLREAEHPLDHAEAVLDLRPHLRLGAVARLLRLVHHPAMPIASVDEVSCVWCMFADHGALPAICLIAPHPRLITMQQIGQHRLDRLRRSSRHVGRRRHHRVDHLAPAVHADMCEFACNTDPLRGNFASNSDLL